MPWDETFDQITEYSQFIGDAYEQATLDLIDLLRRVLEKNYQSAAWVPQKLQAYRAVLKQLGRKVPEMGPEIEKIIEASYDQGVAIANEQLDVLKMPAVSPYARGAAAKALAQEAVKAVNSTRFQILRATADVYREIVANVTAQKQAGTGVLKAIQNGLNDLAERGITGFVDSAGRNWDLTSYVEMAVRTASGQAAREGHDNKLTAAGMDLRIVSTIGATCETCAPWEGKVLSSSGLDPRYPSVDEAKASGHLFGPNCRHALAAYVPGLTSPEGRRVPYDPDGYRARQVQRRNERHIRRWKRRAVAATDPQERRRCYAKARKWEAANRDHIEKWNAIYAERYGEQYKLLNHKAERERIGKLFRPPKKEAA